jgi:hypothetical protein
MRIDGFISFGLQAKLSLQRRIGPIFRGSVGDTSNVAYAWSGSDYLAAPESLFGRSVFIRLSAGRILGHGAMTPQQYQEKRDAVCLRI